MIQLVKMKKKEMRSMWNINSLDEKAIANSKTIEEKLEEAKKDYEKGRTHSEDEVWKMFSKKYGLELSKY